MPSHTPYIGTAFPHCEPTCAASTCSVRKKSLHTHCTRKAWPGIHDVRDDQLGHQTEIEPNCEKFNRKISKKLNNLRNRIVKPNKVYMRLTKLEKKLKIIKPNIFIQVRLGSRVYHFFGNGARWRSRSVRWPAPGGGARPPAAAQGAAGPFSGRTPEWPSP